MLARWSLRLTLLATILTTTACGAPRATPSEAPASQDVPIMTSAPTTPAAISPTPAPVGGPSHTGEATGGGEMGEAVGVTEHVTIVVMDP